MTRRRCSECGAPIVGRRDRLTCSARCRVARGRRLAARCPATDPRYAIRCVLPADHAGDHQGRGGPVWAYG